MGRASPFTLPATLHFPIVLLVSFALLLLSLPTARPLSLPIPPKSSTNTVLDTYGKLPLSFEANRGQTDEQVKFLARGSGYTLFLTSAGAVLSLSKDINSAIDQAVLSMQLAGANPNPQVTGLEELQGKVNYFVGNNSGNWQTDIPTFAKVKYQNVYPGVDLIYYGNQGQLEYDFVVSPSADPQNILLNFEGAEKIEIDSQGNLILHIADEQIQMNKPFIYQEIEGARQEVVGDYVLQDKYQIGFQVGSYDTTEPLIIDPVLVYSTYLGGNGHDFGLDIDVDSAGNAYITGGTRFGGFPTANPLQPVFGGGTDDAFVAKLDPSGSSLVYSTYLGGSSNDLGIVIAADNNGNAYLTGITMSTDFPTANPLQPVFGGNQDGFVVKLNSTGSSLVYSTYLGGTGRDDPEGLAIDSTNNVYITGTTSSNNFPTLNPIQPSLNGIRPDTFITKINTAGSAIIYSTYLGGSSDDFGAGVIVDSTGNALITGSTNSTDFPTQNPLQPIYGGGSADALVVKINSSGSAIVYSSYLGGNANDAGQSIDVDSSGNAYLTGTTNSIDFPTQNAMQPSKSPSPRDAFVTKINPTGSSFIFSTFLGGCCTDSFGQDQGRDIAVDSLNNIYVAGLTSSHDFPIVNAIQPFHAGGREDAFLAKLDATGSILLYSTYLGGAGHNDVAQGLAVHTSGDAYIVGQTDSSNFPLQNPIQSSFAGGGRDAFIAKISDNQPPIADAGPDQTVVVNNLVTLDGSGSSDPDLDPLTFSWSEDASNPVTGVLSDPSSVNPTLTPTTEGIYLFALVVNDGLANSAPDSVIITVQTPSEATQNLIDLVGEFNLQQGIDNSLDAKLDNAQNALTDVNVNNDVAAINSLQAFINSVEAQRGNELTDEQANELIAAAQAIIDSLSAP